VILLPIFLIWLVNVFSPPNAPFRIGAQKRLTRQKGEPQSHVVISKYLRHCISFVPF